MYKDIFMNKLAIVILSLFPMLCMGQIVSKNKEYSKEYLSYLNKVETNDNILKHCDPNFPKRESVSYAYELQAYAKTHRPIPTLKNTGNVESDKVKYETELIRWKKQNSYYPQFIPYSKYQTFFTPEDDIKFYESALKEWIKSNPTEYEECLKKSSGEEILIEKNN